MDFSKVLESFDQTAKKHRECLIEQLKESVKNNEEFIPFSIDKKPTVQDEKRNAAIDLLNKIVAKNSKENKSELEEIKSLRETRSPDRRDRSPDRRDRSPDRRDRSPDRRDRSPDRRDRSPDRRDRSPDRREYRLNYRLNYKFERDNRGEKLFKKLDHRDIYTYNVLNIVKYNFIVKSYSIEEKYDPSFLETRNGKDYLVILDPKRDYMIHYYLYKLYYYIYLAHGKTIGSKLDKTYIGRINVYRNGIVFGNLLNQSIIFEKDNVLFRDNEYTFSLKADYRVSNPDFKIYNSFHYILAFLLNGIVFYHSNIDIIIDMVTAIYSKIEDRRERAEFLNFIFKN